MKLRRSLFFVKPTLCCKMGGQKWPSFFPESCSMCDNVLRSAVAQVFAKPFIPEACKDDNIPLSLYMHYILYNLFFCRERGVFLEWWATFPIHRMVKQISETLVYNMDNWIIWKHLNCMQPPNNPSKPTFRTFSENS